MSASVLEGIPVWAERQRHDPDSSRGVPCPFCADNSMVIDTRPRKNAIRRRRACVKCKRRFTTFEIATDMHPDESAMLLRKQAAQLRQLAAMLEKMAASPMDDEAESAQS